MNDGIRDIEGRPRRDDAQTARRLGFGILIVVVAALLLWFLWPRSASVPSLVGMDEEQARAAIEQAGLKVGTVATRTIDATEAGRVVDQLPPAGARIAAGGAIDYTIAEPSGAATSAAGPGIGPTSEASVYVPEVVGDSEAEAKAALASAGLGSAVGHSPSGMAVGQVIHQSPGGGVFVSPNSVVEITVSTGPGMRGTASVGWSGAKVPDALGKTAAEARSSLASAGYGVRFVYAPSTSTPKGLAFWQSAGPGPESDPPAAIEVWISTGPPTRGAPYPVPPDLDAFGP